MLILKSVLMDTDVNASGNGLLQTVTGDTITNYTDPCGRDNLMIPFLIEMNSDVSVLAYIITIFGLLGNIVTILKVCCDKTIRTPTYVVIAALALADLTSLSQYIIHVMIKKLFQFLDNDQIFMSIHYGVTHLSAAHVLLLLSFRYYILVYPIKSRFLTNSEIIGASFSVWIFSAIFAGIYYVLRFKTCVDTFSVVVGFRSYLLVMPIIIIALLHRLKVRIIGNSTGNNHPKLVKRMSKITGIILAIYMLSASLFPVCFILNATKTCATEQDCTPALVIARITWLFNSSINPVIYFVFSPPIHRTLYRAFRHYSRTSRAEKESSYEMQRFGSSRHGHYSVRWSPSLRQEQTQNFLQKNES